MATTTKELNVSQIEAKIAKLAAQLEEAKNAENEKNKQIIDDVNVVLDAHGITFARLIEVMGNQAPVEPATVSERKKRAQRAWQIASRFESQLTPYSGQGRMPKWLVEMKGSGELDAIGDQLKLVHSQTGEEIDFDSAKLTELL